MPNPLHPDPVEPPIPPELPTDPEPEVPANPFPNKQPGLPDTPTL
jgi:hypothetical protein